MEKSGKLDEKLVSIMENSIVSILAEIEESRLEFSVVVPFDDRWRPNINIETPEEGTGMKIIRVSISNWTREQSFFNLEDNSLWIKTAFGEEESEAVFKASEILQIADMHNNALFVKPYMLAKRRDPDPAEASYSVRGLMGEPEPEDTSMAAMKKNNPDLFKKDKGGEHE